VLIHALLSAEQLSDRRYDVVVMLQPTSPLRRPQHVQATIEKLVDEDWDAVWTVSKTDPKYHPVKQLRLDSRGRMQPYDGELRIVTRQELTPIYHRNGAAYAFTRDCLLNQETILGRSTGAVIIEESMISIDSLEDFAEVEATLCARDP
jgi:CMP-N,N'-diacetyllegionaminic acid synthase